MRADGEFIAIEVDDTATHDPSLAARLADACPVDIYANTDGRVTLVQANLDECILCALCLRAAPGTVRVHKRYSGEELEQA